MEGVGNNRDLSPAKASTARTQGEPPIDIKLYLNDDQIRRCKDTHCFLCLCSQVECSCYCGHVGCFYLIDCWLCMFSVCGKEAFDSFDTDRNGSIEIYELEAALINMGHRPSEEELYSMMSENNKDGESAINWERFQQIIATQKKILEERMRDDLLDTFEALGGSGPDGRLNLNLVKEIILNKFNMNIDIDKMAARADKDGDMTIDFKEFMDIMSG